jgi:hypothetical protein
VSAGVCAAALTLAPVAGGGHRVRAPRTPRPPRLAQRAPAPAPLIPSRFGVSADYLAAATTPVGRQFASDVLGPRGRVRFFVPYDARGFFDGTECAPSPAYSAGASAWATLLAQLAQARADRLAAQIVFTNATGIGGTPMYPDPADGAQASDYACGVAMTLQALWATRQSTGMPMDVEAWNEPDLTGYTDDLAPSDPPCAAPAGSPMCSGPWRAAMLWYLAQTQANAVRQSTPGFPVLPVAALTMTRPQKSSYLDDGHTTLTSPAGSVYPGYYQSLYEIVHCAAGYDGCGEPGANPTTMPTDWSVHDYTDPTADGTGDLRGFAATLAQLNDRFAHGAGVSIWVTESGVQLDAGAQRDANHPGGVNCHSSVASSDTLGCLVDGNPVAQARGAQAWRELAEVSVPTQHGSVQVTQLFWFQFALSAETCSASAPCQLANGVVDTSGQSLPALHTWDSALVDSAGRPRASFCALTGEPAADCQGQPDAYADAHWVNWWQPMPGHCPAHDGAWVAYRADSGVPGGQECFYSAADPPSGTTLADTGANGSA